MEFIELLVNAIYYIVSDDIVGNLPSGGRESSSSRVVMIFGTVMRGTHCKANQPAEQKM